MADYSYVFFINETFGHLFTADVVDSKQEAWKVSKIIGAFKGDEGDISVTFFTELFFLQSLSVFVLSSPDYLTPRRKNMLTYVTCCLCTFISFRRRGLGDDREAGKMIGNLRD